MRRAGRTRRGLAGAVLVATMAGSVLASSFAPGGSVAAGLSPFSVAYAETGQGERSAELALVPGSRVIDLTGMDPALQPEFLRVVSSLAVEYGVDVPFVLPVGRWNAVTGAPSAGGHMFASDRGIGFDPAVWGPGAAEQALETLAAGTHAGANGKGFDGIVTHEMAHVLLAERLGLGLLDDGNAARVVVEAYRAARGSVAVTSELGHYAWSGSHGRPDEAWQETFAEAFAAYVLDAGSLSTPTRDMVAEVLRHCEASGR